MSLTSTEKALVKATFSKVAAISEQAAQLFYTHLFEIAPEVKPLFAHTGMNTQGVMLMQMIGTAVANLDNLDVLAPAVAALGKRHVGYGVQPAHYTKVGEALIWTLEQGLGADFTPEVRLAWLAVYQLLSQTAINGNYARNMTPSQSLPVMP